MIDKKISKNKVEKQIIKINTLKDLKEALEKEGFNINKNDEESFKEEFKTLFQVNKVLLKEIYKSSKVVYSTMIDYENEIFCKRISFFLFFMCIVLKIKNKKIFNTIDNLASWGDKSIER